MYRPISFVHPLLILAVGALALPLCAQEATPPVAAPAVTAAPAPVAPAPAQDAVPAADGQVVAPQGQIIAPDQLQIKIQPQMQGQIQAMGTPNMMQRRDPQARRDQVREQVEMRLRAMMSDFGIEETNKQDALIAYLAEDEAGKATVLEAGRRLLNAIRRGTDPARTRDLVAVYKGALDADKERRTAAQTSLDAKIGFSLNPRLEATLWLFGILGDGQAGLPLNLLIKRPNQNGPRNAGPPNYGPNRGEFAVRDVNGANANIAAANATTPRAGTVFGTVSNKGEGWIEVRELKGTVERYLPFWTAAPVGGAENNAGGYDRAVLEAITIAKAGDNVRLEWVWSDRKRVVKLQPWTPPAPDAAPATQPDAPQDAAPPAGAVPAQGAPIEEPR